MDIFQILYGIAAVYIGCILIALFAPKTELGETSQELRGTMDRLLKLGKGGLRTTNKGLDEAIEQLEAESNAK